MGTTLCTDLSAQTVPHTSYVSPGWTSVTSCCVALPGALLWMLCAEPDSGRAVASISWQAASAWALSASGSAHRTVRDGGLQAAAAIVSSRSTL